MQLPDRFGARLSWIRKKRGLRQEDLAERIGVSEQKIRKWEKDEREPRVSELVQLVKVLEVSIEQLAGAQAFPDLEPTRTETLYFANPRAVQLMRDAKTMDQLVSAFDEAICFGVEPTDILITKEQHAALADEFDQKAHQLGRKPRIRLRRRGTE